MEEEGNDDVPPYVPGAEVSYEQGTHVGRQMAREPLAAAGRGAGRGGAGCAPLSRATLETTKGQIDVFQVNPLPESGGICERLT